eukprot:3302210-Pyramimonas_sp.AAC.1
MAMRCDGCRARGRCVRGPRAEGPAERVRRSAARCRSGGRRQQQRPRRVVGGRRRDTAESHRGSCGASRGLVSD